MQFWKKLFAIEFKYRYAGHCRQDGVETVIRSTYLLKHTKVKKIGKITTNKKGGLSVLLVKIESCEMLIFAHRKLFSDGHVSTSG